MRLITAILFSTCVCCLPILDAQPAQVIIIRHAEKPETGDNLSLQGWQRAAALVPFFLNNQEDLEFGPPFAIYASGPKNSNSSMRSIETVQGLAKTLKLSIDSDYDSHEYDKMVKNMLSHSEYAGKMVLICWGHDHIPKIAQLLGIAHPPKWKSKVYDRLWIITFSPDGTTNFQDLPQRLMFGDSTK